MELACVGVLRWHASFFDSYECVMSPIELANEKINIAQVFSIITGDDAPDLEFLDSGKLYCPFDFTHADDGSKSFRMYGETNSAYCFACGKRWSPVGLYADAEDLQWRDAAEALLRRFEIPQETTEDRWKALTEPQGFSINTAEMAEALKLYCGRICPDWEDRQFNDRISSILSRCLALLTAIKSEEDALLWLRQTKEIMRRALT